MSLEIIKKIRKTIDFNNMLNKGDTVLVGVSSGPDSICLLHVLKEFQDEYDLSLHIAHLHHGLRGEEADEDVRFAQKTGEALGVPVHIEYADIPAYIKETRMSKQAGARQYRYQFFNKVASAIGADRIAVGHTSDDQAETFLMRLLRGTGTHGLAGIPPVRDKIIRPLIDISRNEILEFISERKIQYRIDSSNLIPDYLRNRLRLELIPHLASEYNPNIVDTILRNLEVIREEDRYLQEDAKRRYPSVVVRETGEAVFLDARKFADIPLALRRRILRLAFESLTCENAVALSFRQVDDALSLLSRNKNGEIHFPAGFLAKKEGEVFIVTIKSGDSRTAYYSYSLNIPGETIVPEAGMKINAMKLETSEVDQERGSVGRYKVYFDMDNFSFPLIIRNRKAGDLFCPKGMGGRRKKIKEYFIDRKIPRRERDIVPILVSPEGIMWVIGYREDERFKVTSKTRHILQVTAAGIAA